MMSTPTVSLHAARSRAAIGRGFPAPILRPSTRVTGKTQGLALVKSASSAV
jgi:hypothetical protein